MHDKIKPRFSWHVGISGEDNDPTNRAKISNDLRTIALVSGVSESGPVNRDRGTWNARTRMIRRLLQTYLGCNCLIVTSNLSLSGACFAWTCLLGACYVCITLLSFGNKRKATWIISVIICFLATCYSTNRFIPFLGKCSFWSTGTLISKGSMIHRFMNLALWSSNL